MSVGDQPELQVFTGPLADGKHVAVLLNRDEIQVSAHTILSHRLIYNMNNILFCITSLSRLLAYMNISDGQIK